LAITSTTKSSGKLAASTLNAIDALDAMWREVELSRECIVGAVVPRPQNSFTRREYIKTFDSSDSAAHRTLAKMVKAKKLTVAYSMVPNGVGSLVRTACYSPVKI
jgi:hypothetical protein